MIDYTQFVKPYKEPELSNDVWIDIDLDARYVDELYTARSYGLMKGQERRLNMKDKGKFIYGNDEYIVHDAEIVESPGCEGRLTARVSKKIHHNNINKDRHLAIVANNKEEIKLFKTSVVCFFNKMKKERDDLEIFEAELIGIPMPTEGFNIVYFTTEDPHGRVPSDSKVIFLPKTTPKDIANFLLGREYTAARGGRSGFKDVLFNNFCALDIEKIEINTKKDAVAVFWLWNNFPEDSEFGTSDRVTVVKRKDGDPFNIFNAVAAAFCINKYKTRSHFRKVLRDKYGTDDVYETAAMFELIEHFGSIKKVEEIVKERSECIGLFDEPPKNSIERSAAEVNKALKKFGEELVSIFGRKGN